MSNTYQANINDEYLTDYYAVKRKLNMFRNVFFPVTKTLNNFGLIFSNAFTNSTLLHAIPYVGTVYAVIESLRQVLFTPFDKNKTGLQKATTLVRATSILAMCALFTFVFPSPYAGTIAYAIADFGFKAITTGLAKAFNFYKPVSKSAPQKKLAELNNARTKENIYNTALSAVTLVGAGLLFVPGLQPVAASILIAVSLFTIADAVFYFPFPWRKKKKEVKDEIRPKQPSKQDTIDHATTYKRLLQCAPLKPAPAKTAEPSQTKAAMPKAKSSVSFFKEPQRSLSAASASALCRGNYYARIGISKH